MSAVKPHRLSLSDILTLMLSRGSTERSSVTLTRNAKGETQIEVTARTGGEETIEDAERVAGEVYDRLRSTYPLSSGYVGATPAESPPSPKPPRSRPDD